MTKKERKQNTAKFGVVGKEDGTAIGGDDADRETGCRGDDRIRFRPLLSKGRIDDHGGRRIVLAGTAEGGMIVRSTPENSVGHRGHPADHLDRCVCFPHQYWNWPCASAHSRFLKGMDDRPYAPRNAELGHFKKRKANDSE